MSDPDLTIPYFAAGAPPSTPSPFDENSIIVGCKSGICWVNGGHLDVIMRSQLPGIVIFVHGVNSDGEWYKAAEAGLCAGLNDRLKRCDEHMAYPTAEGGQLTPATYTAELTADGFLNPKASAKTFITGDAHFTPVIQFRWGYKASLIELQQFGEGIYLNEQNYWGGGPFANGCTTLPDLWGEGLSEHLFLGIQIEHLNPTPDRPVFSCPPRPYFVLAALRLARLIESIRRQQADVPITVVCHSQGNMVAMAAAFLGDALDGNDGNDGGACRAPVTDGVGIEGRRVANNYVLCNPPYSLAKDNTAEAWGDRDRKDQYGGSGRQNLAARIGTLRAFLDLVRQPACRPQEAAAIDSLVANDNHGFNIGADRALYSCGKSAVGGGRVTLYCNPHDQVISSTPVQGIGWRGMSVDEIKAVGGAGIFYQRVFAQGYKVGVQGVYDYWTDHYKQPARGSVGFWVPASLPVQYSVPKGLYANRGNVVAQIFTIAVAPFVVVPLAVLGPRINALPDEYWWIPLDAPNLPVAFTPQALRFGVCTDQFDQIYDARGQGRAMDGELEAGSPYAGNRPLEHKAGEAPREASDAGMGDAGTAAAQRYDDHARLRMQARREGRVKKTAEHVEAEDDPTKADAEHTTWRNKKIKTFLADNVDTHATDHSTIMTNDMHARMALAYDVAIGLCHIRDEELHKLRIAADWRYLKELDEGDSSKVFEEYFLSGRFKDLSTFDWANNPGDGRMPDKIVDQREHPRRSPQSQEGSSRGGHR